MIVVLLGPPGCGKGTQGERLAAALGVPKISTGDVIRAAMKAGTPLGLQAKSFYDKGDLVPDALILDIMREALAAPAQAKGAILDGVVRTVPQAEGLAQVLSGLGKRLDLVLMFQIADEELVGRLSARTVCGASWAASRASCTPSASWSPRATWCGARTTSLKRSATGFRSITRRRRPCSPGTATRRVRSRRSTRWARWMR
jgi:adenylate kinase